MWNDLKNFTLEIFETHRTRKIGFVIGIIVGITILLFGFFNTFFALLCGLAGLYIGAKFDNGDELIDNTLRKLNKILPEKFQRW